MFLDIVNDLNITQLTAAAPKASLTVVAADTVNGGLKRVDLGVAKVEVQATTPRTLTANESGITINNTGATALIVVNLPAAAAGLRFTFVVLDTDGIKAVAATGDTITIDGTTSGAAGFCTSTTIGDTVTLEAQNATQWVAVASLGAGGWTVT
jgi:hypothetical protein